GGFVDGALIDKIQVKRKGEVTLFNLKKYLNTGDESTVPAIQSLDEIFVPAALGLSSVHGVGEGGSDAEEDAFSDPSSIKVFGEVLRPVTFRYREGVNLIDAILKAGGVSRYGDLKKIRVVAGNDSKIFDLKKFLEMGDKKSLPELEEGATVYIPKKGEVIKDAVGDGSWHKLATKDTVKVLGSIRKPGRYKWSDQIDFMDYLTNAGGPSDNADLSKIQVLLPDEKGEAASQVFNLQQFIEQGGSWSKLPKIVGGASIIIPQVLGYPADAKTQWVNLPKEKAIYVMGSVTTPGRYAFSPGMGFLDVLAAADGPAQDADLSQLRIVHRSEGSPRVSKLDLVNYFETGDDSLLPEVKPGDSIFVPSRNRKWLEKKREDTVRVLGAVKTSGRYDFDSNMTILDLLAEAGGPTKTAHVEKIIIVNNSCCQNQAYTFDLMKFMRNPVASYLPVLRPGDTIYV
ncbi:MAG: SLBB domain-containing protein, partial [Endozoicomonas sp.]